jgi:periplasmic protein TonB
MKTTAVTQTWEDIVFEHRNKDYGAYLNRRSYSKTIVIAMLLTFLVMAFVLAFPTIKEWLSSSDDVVDDNKLKSQTVSLDQPPPITPNQPPPPDIRIPPPVKTIIKFLPPKVTEKEVVEEEEMPTIEEIKQNETGSENVEGTTEVVFEEPVAEVKEEEDANKVFLVVEQPPEFEGGLEAMYKFINKNMKYPASARRMNIEGSVFVGFVVDADGKISEAAIIKGISADCDKEALRVVQMMPKWRPGKQSGRPVRVKFVLPIRFKLD